MINLDQIFKDLEGKSCEIQEERLKSIFEKQKTKFLKEEHASFTYYQLLMLILINPLYKEYRNLVLKQLLDFDERYIIYSYLNFINSPEIASQLTKPILENYFSNSPFLYNYKKLENGYNFETEHGKLTAYKLDSVFKNSPLIPIIKKFNLARHCHQVVEEYSPLVSNGFAITSEMTSLFGDTLYHSYFEQQDWILDIAGNTLYPKDSFQKYYTPNELVRIPTNEIAQEIAKLPPNLDSESQKASNLLKLALLNKREK